MCGSTENTNQNKTARQLELDPTLQGWNGDARRYELSEPLDHPLFEGVKQVVVSGVVDAPDLFDPSLLVSETVVFPLDDEGLAWPMSLVRIADRGDAHEEALQQLSYELVAA